MLIPRAVIDVPCGRVVVVSIGMVGLGIVGAFVVVVGALVVGADVVAKKRTQNEYDLRPFILSYVGKIVAKMCNLWPTEI